MMVLAYFEQTMKVAGIINYIIMEVECEDVEEKTFNRCFINI